MLPELQNAMAFCTDDQIALIDPTVYTLWNPKNFRKWTGTGSVTENGFLPDAAQPVTNGIAIGDAIYIDNTTYGGLYIIDGNTNNNFSFANIGSANSGSTIPIFTLPTGTSATVYTFLPIARAVSADIVRAVGLDPLADWDKITPGAFIADWCALECLRRIYLQQAAEASVDDTQAAPLAMAQAFQDLATRAAARANFEYIDRNGNTRNFAGGEARLKRV